MATRREQVEAYYARKRTRGMRTVISSLAQTANFASGTTGIDTGDSFPDRNRPTTLRFRLQRTAATASGDVVTLGSAARRLQVSVTDQDLTANAGGTGDDQASVTVVGALPVQDQVFDVAVWAEPGTGRLAVWGDGQLRGSDTAVNGNFGGAWADDDPDGTVGASLMNLEIGAGVDVFDGQGPRRRKA